MTLRAPITLRDAGFGALSRVREIGQRNAQARDCLRAVPGATFKVELICIMDAIDRGGLVFCNASRQIILPPSRLIHWAKRWFECIYLRKYR